MSLLPDAARRSGWARRALAFVIAVHGVLLVLMLRDYFADNDLGYHISLARQYAEHGMYWWDTLNWAPTGRPNLQGPALHYAIALVGLLLGGDGWDYVHAFSILAVGQWVAAVFTAAFFARRFGGDWAALFAVALLTGNVYSAAPFFVGVPSGWIFILSAWAIHFFLQERYVRSALFGALTAYVHLGGAPVVAVGIGLAGLLTRRWKGLLFTGVLTLLLASPYVIHFLRHVGWYTGRRGHVAGSVAWFTYGLAVPGLAWLMSTSRLRKQGLFLLLWAIAPVAWLFQDPLRFLLQSTIAASVIAAVFLSFLLMHLAGDRMRAGVAAGVVLVANLFPFAIPSLAVEAAWAAGRGFPRELDWKEAEALSRVVEEAGLQGRIFAPYYDSLCGAVAVFVPVRQRWGHWGEVRPAVDPADSISTGAFAHLLPLPPDDSFLLAVQARGLGTSHGGGRESAIVTLPAPGDPGEVRTLVADVIRREAGWLEAHAVPNLFPDPALLFDPAALEARRARMAEQKRHVGRIQLAVLLYAYAIEADHPEVAAGVRRSARGWGGVANFLGDETAIDYIDRGRFARFLSNLAVFAREAQVLRRQPLPSLALDAATDRLFDEFF